ncbi:hypothetical protein H8959_021429 [Pygathrix nigripes]
MERTGDTGPFYHATPLSPSASSPFPFSRHKERKGAMKKENQSSHLDFILLGVTGQQEQNNVFFVIFWAFIPSH